MFVSFYDVVTDFSTIACEQLALNPMDWEKLFNGTTNEYVSAWNRLVTRDIFWDNLSKTKFANSLISLLQSNNLSIKVYVDVPSDGSTAALNNNMQFMAQKASSWVAANFVGVGGASVVSSVFATTANDLFKLTNDVLIDPREYMCSIWSLKGVAIKHVDGPSTLDALTNIGIW